ncbi:unnamed protein product [Notodromas monacha]|uniref:EF-hand domain-containing protein n=1 Tax=Notodromas monacha TaxID=399045 RepID=A0A7R9C153_9CRUS|nr:unnamed protein product [Notodromas monacha]CAG0925490.1 unnamed protein product [Notodromas monacha]
MLFLKENPFRKRLCQVFSKNNSGALTFDDFLDMMSVLSEASPRQIRVAYAFRIFDYNDDGYLGWSDLEQAANELTSGGLDKDEVHVIVGKIMEEGDIDDDGKLSFIEFQHIIERTPDFMTNFHVRI